VVDFGRGGCCNQFYDFNVQESGNQIILGGGCCNLTWYANRSINDGSWHQVTVTSDGVQTVTAYLDGQSLGAQTQNLQTCQGYSQTSCILEVGGPNSYTGTVDEVAIYPTALSATQISNHFTASGYTAPSVPGSVTASAGSNSISVTWTASTATVPSGQPAVQGYVVTAYKNGTTPQNAVATPGTATSATIGGLVAGTAYTVQVVGFNQFGSGAPGISASVTPTGASTTYASTVLGDAPAIFWRLGEPGGSVAADSSGNGNTGTYSSSGVTYGAAGAPLGDADTAVSLSGGNVTGYSQGGVPVGNAARTAEAWIKTTAGNESVLDFGRGGCCNQFYEFNVLVSGNQITLGGGGNNLTWYAPRAINDGSWHQVTVTTDGTQTITTYLDGQSLGAQTQSLQTCQGYSPTACILEVG
jgi:hypothetical protein